MDLGTAAALIAIAALVGVGATVAIIARREREALDEDPPFAASSEGMTACRQCGNANPVGEDACLYCGTPLPRHVDVA